MALSMKEKFARVNLSKLPDNVKSEFDLIKSSTENFDADLVPVFQDNFDILYGVVEKKYPDALKLGGTLKKVKSGKVKKITKREIQPDSGFDPKNPQKGLRGYAKKISEISGITDKKDLDAIEEIMRNEVFHSTLDWQDAKEFEKGVKEAVKIDFERMHPKKNWSEMVHKSRGKKFEMTHKSRGKKNESGDIDDCRKILSEAGYSTKKRLSKSGKQAMKVKEPRPERTIIKDKVEGVFTTISKDISGSKEKDEKYASMQKALNEAQSIITKLFTLLNNLAEDNSTEKVEKIIMLLKKIVP